MDRRENILKSTRHRPDALPQRRWQFHEEWHHITFQHWPVDSNHLKTFLPEYLTFDTYQDVAWVSLMHADVRNLTTNRLDHNAYIDFKMVQLHTFTIKNGVAYQYVLDQSIGTISNKMKSILQHCNNNAAPQHFSSLDHWLLNRFHVLTCTDGQLYDRELHHIDWLEAGLSAADPEATFHTDSIGAPALQHHCNKIDVIWWDKVLVTEKMRT